VPYLIDWAEMFVRWLHVIAGIAWIGSSFYFVHLDLSLKKRDGLPEGAAGEAWQVHGGGFYNMVKYLVAPARMPDELTWFKWEAYTTWISGAGLMVIVYYLGAELYLLDRTVLGLEPWQTVLASVLSIAAGWVIYDGLCKSSLGQNNTVLLGLVFLLLTGAAWLFGQFFIARGAFMQMGALIGTIMVANVAMIIIPNQRKVVADLIAGRTPDPTLGAKGKQRSLHNNYLTLPVVWIMLGTHYPLTHATKYMWLMLALVFVIGVSVRHFFNTRHKGLPSPWWTWGVAVASAIGIVVLGSAGPSYGPRVEALPTPVAALDAQYVVVGRCSMCHAESPSWDGVRVAPGGVLLDTPERVNAHARQIASAAVWTNAMPPGNVTEMTLEERRVVATWLQQKGF
jgi:uncharacterized membrane protein